MNPYRVIQWGTGNTGGKALRFILTDPTFQLVGLYVAREQNIGRDAGELVGLDSVGVAASSNVDAIVALDADCVVYMAAEPLTSPATPGSDGWQSVDMICRLLASGKNVVSTGISGLTNPRAFGEGVAGTLCDAALEGGSTFFGTGIEPGFMCDALALTLSSVTRNVRAIRAQEILSYATYDQPKYHVSNGGMWGAPCDQSLTELFAAGILDCGMGAPIRLLADALGINLDEVIANVEFAPAPEAFDLPIGAIGQGSIAGYRFEILGKSNGEAVLALEHITRLHDLVAPQWPTLEPGGFRILLEGTPSYRVDVVVDEPDASMGACTGTAARAVNAIPVVCAAPAGVCSFVDLPLISALPRIP